jgi:hypothetical protein
MPVNISLLPDEVIARGVPVPDTSKLFEGYFQGSDQAQKQAALNLFAQGIPRLPDGSIDYAKAAEMVLQTQGAAGLAPALGASKFGLLSDYFKGAGATDVANPGLPPQPDRRSEGPLPPSISRSSLAQADNSGGEPLRPGQLGNLGEITGIQRGPIEGNPNLFRATGFAPETPVTFDERTTGDSAELPPNFTLAQAQQGGTGTRTIPLGGRDAAGQPLPPTGTYTTVPQQSTAPTGDVGGVPAAPSASGGLVISEENAQRFERAASTLYRRAEALAALDPAMGRAAQSRADSYSAVAKQIREGLIKAGELTTEEKNARGAGVPTLEYDRRKKYGELDAKTFSDEMTSINSAATNAASGLPKAALGKQLTQQPGFYSGPLNEYNTGFQQFRNMFGNPGAALPAEAFDKVANDLLQEQIKSMGQSGVGRVLQSEVAIMRRAIASMGITDVSNRALLEIVSRTYRKAQEIADLTRDLPPDSRQLNKVILGYLRKKPIFSEDELANPRLLGSKEPPPQSARWSKQQMIQWGAQNGLKPGDPIMFNGQLGQIPLQAQ